MKKSLAVLLPVLLLALAEACSGPAPQEFTTRDAGTIRQQSDALASACNEKQVAKILDLYAENSVFMPPNEPMIRGKQALKDFYDDLLLKQGASNLKLNVDEVFGHGPIAYQSGTQKWT
jgi:ketosteroid isomerase-like protein